MVSIKNIFKRKSKFDNLVKVFSKSGRTYYKFPKEVNLPIERFSMVMALMERLSSGLSGNELNLILEKMDLALSAGLSNPKNAALIATYIHIIRERNDTVIHRDILINLAATWLVRDDENPSVINVDIHKEKVNQFDAMCKEGSHDFFTQIGIEPLMPLLTMSASDFQTLWDHNVVQQESLIKALTQLDSHRDSRQTKSSPS
jgi:hypothetical protein